MIATKSLLFFVLVVSFATANADLSKPATPRPYRAFGYPFTTGAAVLISLAFLVGVIAADTRKQLVRSPAASCQLPHLPSSAQEYP